MCQSVWQIKIRMYIYIHTINVGTNPHPKNVTFVGRQHCCFFLPIVVTKYFDMLPVVQQMQ